MKWEALVEKGVRMTLADSVPECTADAEEEWGLFRYVLQLRVYMNRNGSLCYLMKKPRGERCYSSE